MMVGAEHMLRLGEGGATRFGSSRALEYKEMSIFLTHEFLLTDLFYGQINDHLCHPDETVLWKAVPEPPECLCTAQGCNHHNPFLILVVILPINLNVNNNINNILNINLNINNILLTCYYEPASCPS